MRRTAEDALAHELTARGAQGIAGYTLLTAPEARNPGGGATDTAARRRRGHRGSADRRSHPRDITYFPPTFWGYWGVDWSSYPDPNDIRIDTVVWVEARAYSVVQNKLLWAGESVATNDTTVDAFVKGLGAKAAEAVQHAGLLGK